MADKKESPQLSPADFQLAETVRETWRIYPAMGVTREHLLEPAYWAHISKRLRPGARVEAFAQDGTYYAELLVLACERTWAKVHVLSWHNLTNTDVSQTQALDPFRVEYRGPKKMHCVVRASDGEIIHEGSQTKDAAKQWLEERRSQLTPA